MWNPSQQGPTAAQLQSNQQINPINMAGVVTAILEHQRMQQEQQRQYQAQLAQGVSALSHQYEQGQQDDLANRALYQAQNPTDPYRGQSGYDNRVPDYGGMDALKMQEIQAQLQYKQAQAQQAVSHAQYWQNHVAGAGAGVGSDGITQPSIYTDDTSGQRYIMGKNGVPHLIKPQAQAASSPFLSESDVNAIDTAKSDTVTDSHGNVTAYKYVTKDGRQLIVPKAQIGRLGSILHGSNYPDATPSSHTSTRAGAGPTQGAITYLQQHPELAGDFDSKYGKGQAATYLDNSPTYTQ